MLDLESGLAIEEALTQASSPEQLSNGGPRVDSRWDLRAAWLID